MISIDLQCCEQSQNDQQIPPKQEQRKCSKTPNTQSFKEQAFAKQLKLKFKVEAANCIKSKELFNKISSLNRMDLSTIVEIKGFEEGTLDFNFQSQPDQLALQVSFIFPVSMMVGLQGEMSPQQWEDFENDVKQIFYNECKELTPEINKYLKPGKKIKIEQNSMGKQQIQQREEVEKKIASQSNSEDDDMLQAIDMESMKKNQTPKSMPQMWKGSTICSKYYSAQIQYNYGSNQKVLI